MKLYKTFVVCFFLALCSVWSLLTMAEDEHSDSRVVASGQYSLSNSWSKSRERLGYLQENLDPQSQARVKPLLKPGGDYLDIGPGLGSMTRFFADHAGAEGSVMALDINDRFLAEVAAISPQVKAVHGDVTRYDLGENQFDLIYIRLVLLHLTRNDNQALIARLHRALKPGGYLFIDEFVESADINRFWQLGEIDSRLPGYIAASYECTSNHIDFDQGYRLPTMMSAAGLVNIDTDLTQRRVQGGDNAHSRQMQLAFEQLEAYITTLPDHQTLFPLIQAAWTSPEAHWYDHKRLFVVGQKSEH